MKTLKKSIFVFMAVMAISLGSCKKDDDGGGGGGATAGEGQIVAKVNGNSFTSMEMASMASIANGGGQTTAVLQGSDANGKAIHLIINAFDGVGTYEITSENVFILASYIEANVSNPMNSQTWTAPYQDSGVVGEIKVSERTDTKIKGTFKFKAKHPEDNSFKDVTDGSFNLKIQ